jgi:hypothetical protein
VTGFRRFHQQVGLVRRDRQGAAEGLGRGGEMRHGLVEAAGGGSLAALVLAGTAKQHPALEARRLALQAALQLCYGLLDGTWRGTVAGVQRIGRAKAQIEQAGSERQGDGEQDGAAPCRAPQGG